MKPFACTTASAPLSPSAPSPSSVPVPPLWVNAGAGAVRVVLGLAVPPLSLGGAVVVLVGVVEVAVVCRRGARRGAWSWSCFRQRGARRRPSSCPRRSRRAAPRGSLRGGARGRSGSFVSSASMIFAACSAPPRCARGVLPPSRSCAHREQVLHLEARVIGCAAVPLLAESRPAPRRALPRGRSCAHSPGRRSSGRTCLEVLAEVTWMLEGRDLQVLALERAEVDAIAEQLAHVRLAAPQRRRLCPGRGRRGERPHRAEQRADHALGRPVQQPDRATRGGTRGPARRRPLDGEVRTSRRSRT